MKHNSQKKRENLTDFATVLHQNKNLTSVSENMHLFGDLSFYKGRLLCLGGKKDMEEVRR